MLQLECYSSLATAREDSKMRGESWKVFTTQLHGLTLYIVAQDEKDAGYAAFLRAGGKVTD
jgi:hypothetical protein